LLVQEITNFDSTIYLNDSAPYVLTIQQTVAFSINSPGIVPSDVTVTYLALPYSQDLSKHRARKGTQSQASASSSTIAVSYVISTLNALDQTNSESAYVTYTTNLNNSVYSGVFDAYLQINAVDNNAAGFESSFATAPAFVPLLPTANPTSPPAAASSSRKLSGGAVAGIVIAVLIVSGAAGGVAYWYTVSKRRSDTDDAADPSTITQTNSSSAKGAVTKQTDKQQTSTPPPETLNPIAEVEL
jgi:hypothetical protein